VSFPDTILEFNVANKSSITIKIPLKFQKFLHHQTTVTLIDAKNHRSTKNGLPGSRIKSIGKKCRTISIRNAQIKIIISINVLKWPGNQPF
jgi:hypothetical protein